MKVKDNLELLRQLLENQEREEKPSSEVPAREK